MRKIFIGIVLICSLKAGIFTKIEKSCNQKKAQSCTNLGILYQTGEGVFQSYDKAAFYYLKACDLKCAEGCKLLGDLYYFVQIEDYNNTKAELYYSKSCMLHSQDGCKSLQKLKNPNKALQEELEKLKQEQELLMQEAEVLDNI